MVTSDTRDDPDKYRTDDMLHEDDQAACGGLCHASLMSLAGLASYAVYHGLATDTFVNRRADDINHSK